MGPGGVRAAVTTGLDAAGGRPLAAVSAGGRQCHRVEGFRDGAAGAAHVGTQAFTDFVERAPDLVAAQPQIIYVDAADVPGWGPMGEIQPRG